MIEDKLDRMIELLEAILNKLNYPCHPYYPCYPYHPWYEPFYVTTTSGTYQTHTNTATEAETR